MILLAGTLPIKDFPLTLAEGSLRGDTISLDGLTFPCGMGSGAMMSAVMVVLDYFGLPAPHLLVAGDIGDTSGSRQIYRKAGELIGENRYSHVTLHYLQPIVTLMNQFCGEVEKCESKPFLIADAGSMYAAKAAKRSGIFNLFTPDAAEMKFLADPEAMHPAYVSNYFMQTGNDDVPMLAESAWRTGTVPEHLIIKGKTDYIAHRGKVIHTTTLPDIPLLEPVGGTGDTITGIATGLIAAGLPVSDACRLATVINREAGLTAKVRPDTRVYEIIAAIGPVLKNHRLA